jgi:hypothetical protein
VVLFPYKKIELLAGLCTVGMGIMSNKTKFKCSACNKEDLHDSSRGSIPFAWCNRNIEGAVYMLCDSCGVDGSHAVDISPRLCELSSAKGIYFKGCKQWNIEPS